MSKIEGGNLLANIRPVLTAQPTSSVAKAKEAKEASNIQPVEKQVTLVSEEDAFDKLNKSYESGEIDQEAVKELKEKFKEAAKPRTAEVDDPTTYVAGEHQAGNVIVDDRIDDQDVSVYVAPELVRTVGSLTAELVKDTIKGSETMAESTESKLAMTTTHVDADKIREDIEKLKMSKDPEAKPDTEFLQYKENPIHTQSSYEVTMSMKENITPFLHPETKSELDMTPEKEYEKPEFAPDKSQDLPDNVTKADHEVQREDRFQNDLKETLLHEVNVQEQAMELSSQTRAEVAAAPLVAQTNAPVEIENNSSETTSVEAVAETPSVQGVAAQAQENPVATATVDETLPEVRPELQSPAKAQAKEAIVSAGSDYEIPELDLPDYEMPELDLPEYQPVQGETTNNTAQTTETSEYEPQLIETGTQVEEKTAEDYFAPLPGSDSAEETSTAEEYFAPLPGQSEATSSSQSIETANKREVVQEAIETATKPEVEVQEIEVETAPAESSNVQVLSDEELALLRSSAMNHNVDTREIPVEEKTYEIPQQNNVTSESWVNDAVNYNTAERYSTSIGNKELDLTEFEQQYIPEEPTTLEDYDYTLVANRISEAAASIVPQELLNTFGS